MSGVAKTEAGATLGAAAPSDLDERLRGLEETQRATLNILEDFDWERDRLGQVQQATVNLLEDFDEERRRYHQAQAAALNLLEDFDEERRRYHHTQAAAMNILEDFDGERRRYQLILKASLNLLEDVNEERARLGQTQRALVNMLEDIEVERAKAEQAKKHLESVNKELEGFSYSVSHDLRAPLRAISGFAEAVVEDYTPLLDDQGKRYLGLIQDNAHKMGRLIDDLLAFSRLGRQAMRFSELDMGALAKEVFDDLARGAPGRDIEFTVHPVPPAHADRTLVRQVLVNLLANAIKFTRPKEKALIEFGYLVSPEAGAYYVKDNGVGFDMKYAEKLFGVFQRLHSAEEFEGTGVGLALVSRIVTRHGGRVWAEAEVDRGATFYFTLPAVEGE